MSVHVVHVSDRESPAMCEGAVFERWPEGPVPTRSERVTVFDAVLNFTQHDVLSSAGRRVTLGPAIPWDAP